MGEIYYDKNIDEAEQYFTIAIRSFLEKVVEKDIYFGETDFEYMFNDFRNGILKFSVFYRIVCQHQNDPYCQKLKVFADSRKDNKLT
jgi:hypothetical protein